MRNKQVFEEETAWRAMAFDTHLGWIAVAGRDGTVGGISIAHATASDALRAVERLVDGPIVPDSWSAELARRFKSYARGDEGDFNDLRLDLGHLTGFQRRVVELCRRIPRGETLSYGELARQAGAPGAARAVGNVMANNRFPLVVPCHRVIAADGRLGGFSARNGLRLKRRLLDLEAQPVHA
jgi:methylated-DNA-[protein]-cysteine S-methyltransferase